MPTIIETADAIAGVGDKSAQIVFRLELGHALETDHAHLDGHLSERR